ncbi:MAG TPA: NAD(P)H-quinone oxidoreductase [Capsulimonadaceae bacterium]|jgi:NADPH2:quinone reductase
MKAVLVDHDKKLNWADVPDPVIKSDEVLVRVQAAGVNRADLMQRNGQYPPPPGWPAWMGLEVAGVIEAIGDEAHAESSYRVGDRVCALLGGGGYAEFVAVPYQLLMPVPAWLSTEEAAAVPEVYATAHLNLFGEGQLRNGETLLVHAAASGVGIAATQLAHAAGARVIATVRSDEKADAIRQHGAALVVNSSKVDVRDIFASNEINVVLDCVGGRLMGDCFASMARFGRWIVIATLAGDVTQLDLKTLFVKRLKLIGSTLRSRTVTEKAAVLSRLVSDVYPAFDRNTFRPVLHKILPIAEVEAAHEILARNENIGKVVLRVGS